MQLKIGDRVRALFKTKKYIKGFKICKETREEGRIVFIIPTFDINYTFVGVECIDKTISKELLVHRIFKSDIGNYGFFDEKVKKVYGEYLV